MLNFPRLFGYLLGVETYEVITSNAQIHKLINLQTHKLTNSIIHELK